MTKLIRHHLEQIPIIKKHMNTFFLANTLYTSLVDGAETLNLTLTYYDRFLRKKDHINPLSQDDIDMVTILYLEFRDFVGDVDLSEESLGHEKKWHLYLPLLQRILVIFEEHHQQSRLKLRLFDLVPQFTYRRRYLPVDTDALYDILKIAQHPLVAGVTKTQFGQDAHNNWRQVFDVAKYGDRFRCYLETDTTAVSILVTKPTLPSTQTDWDTIDITGKVVVGLDPGRRDLFNTCDSRERVSSCSTKEYRAMAGFIKNRRKLKGWLRRAPHIQHLTNDLPTSRTSSKDAFLIHCHSAISEYPALHDFFGAPRFRNLAFSNYVGKQKALSKLCRRIIGKIKDWFHADVVVAFGGGRFSSSSRGHASGPIKQLFHQLKRRCITKYVSEFRTSQVCAEFLVRYLFML